MGQDLTGQEARPLSEKGQIVRKRGGRVLIMALRTESGIRSGGAVVDDDGGFEW